MNNNFFSDRIFRFFYAILFINLFIFNPSQVLAGNDNPGANFIIFIQKTPSLQMNAFAGKAVLEIKETCSRMGRFLTVEDSVEKYAHNTLLAERKKSYEETALELGLDFYFTVKITAKPGGFRGVLGIVPVNRDYIRFKQTVSVDAGVIMNIPVKLCRELAYIHKSMPLRIGIIKKTEDKKYIINAGQWHGLKTGIYRFRNGSCVNVISTSRYTALAEIESPFQGNMPVELYPDVNKEILRLERIMEINIDAAYGSGNTILKSTDPEKRFVQAACVINPGANACLPGYGSFLAADYMGFKKTKPDYAGILIGTGVIFSHLTAVEFMTGFKGNFFPWIKDRDKSEREQNLQWFMLGTLPLGMTASYFHQLSSQYEYTRHLPPFFDSRDEAAVSFSLIVPGGGLFYKGYRFTGWAYYLSEITLGAYGTYNAGRKKAVYAFSALALIKAAEIIHSALAPVSYGFYQNEIRRGNSDSAPEFMMSVNPLGREDILMVGLKMYIR